ncbi:MAG: GNAT family acetyltransferase [Acidimicrobiales bacterium]|jgi:ribosomal protein S18 acetylase RimI-like enzyme
MDVQALGREHRGSAVALWSAAGLTRPWNDPLEDFDRALIGPSSAVLGVVEADEVLATAMVGHDGHRGWVYYLCVAPAHQGRGLGSAMMGAAEQWLRHHGAVKVQVMVRHTNASAVHFYEHLGYETSEVAVLARRL